MEKVLSKTNRNSDTNYIPECSHVYIYVDINIEFLIGIYAAEADCAKKILHYIKYTLLITLCGLN